MSEPIQRDPAPFLAGGGRAAEMILARDWTRHPLGPIDRWPEALKTALSLVVNSPESMILAWGPDLHFFFNETYFPLLGPRLDWAMGARFDEVWADALAQAQPIIDEAFAGRPARFTDLPWKLSDDRGAVDTWWTFSYSRVLDADGSVAGLFIFTNETTGRVLADRALATALDDLQSLNATLERRVEERTAERDRLWQTSPDLLAVLDADGIASRANPSWMTILGYAPDEIEGCNLLEFVHPDDMPATLTALAVATDGPLPNFENRFRHRDGSYRWFSWVGAPHGAHIYATGRHITPEKEAAEALHLAEEQLRQSQKLEAVGQLTGGVAHDFNNLLTIISGSAELLARPGLSDQRRDRYMAAIADTAARATRLTSQLLAFSRRQALTPEIFDAGESLMAMREMLQTLVGSRIVIGIDPGPDTCLVNADRNQFDTAVVNIVANARDAMQGEGRLTIRVACAVHLPMVRGQAPVEGDFVAVSIEDSGRGIPDHLLDQIFEPFFTTKRVGHGTGLGLSQVFGFAKQSGGEIHVASAEGEGATFTLYLPRTDGPATAHAPANGAVAASAPRAGAGLVLVVEDNHEVGRFARDALAELGYDSVVVSDAATALAELAARDGKVDMVLSDVVMPGMSGLDLAQELVHRHPGLPVVLASGYSGVLAESGAQGFELLHKPYSLESLGRALARLAEH